MKVQYSESKCHAYFGGYKFNKDKTTGYYLSSKKINNKRVRLHIYVWSFFNGKIQEAMHVHHVDGNKSNNEIGNLKAMPISKHLSHHAKEYASKNKESVINNLINNVIPKATEWHDSAEGKEWHKKHYEEMKSALFVEREFICGCCGKRYKSIQNGSNRFCSNSCKSKHRYKSGIDNEERSCEVCGEIFKTNKYGIKKTCSKECAVKLRKSKIDRIHR